jgi:serine/threonine protein kinase
VNPERFARLRELVLTLQHLPREGRAAYLDEACGADEELRREAEGLLSWDPETGLAGLAATGGVFALLDMEPAALAGGPLELPEKIGPYHVLGVLGHGGMGIVYRAEQREPIRRDVAIKRVPPGLDRGSVLARFEAERQALALMEHPGIARVLDAGEDDDGRPYFAMELVRGVSITEFCRAGGLPLRDRLRLFRDVCHAVQHAHQKGIIHRDLKPSNLLVTTQAGQPAPKVIDFGIAKAVEGEGRGTSLTREGQLIGTIEYMSPEQVGGRSADVDTRSDVYSLGVVLYELVSGSLPYDTRGKAIAEAARIIAVVPPRSLTRIDSDVSTIARKALEKEPDRRYATAAALAEDIDRWLDGLPILARPPSSTYQLRKLVARHKVPFAMAAALFAAIVVFAAAQAAERARAEAEAEKAKQVSEFLRNMLSSVESEGEMVTVREVLDVAARDLDSKFGNEPEVAAALHSTIGNAYTALAQFDEAERHLQRSLELRRRLFGDRHPQVAESLSEQAAFVRARSWDTESIARADSLARLALAMRRETLGEDHPDIAPSLAELAGLETDAGRYAEADSLYREAISRTRLRLGGDHPEVARLLQGWAHPLFYQQKQEEAKAAMREAVAIMRRSYPGDHADKADCIHDLAFLIEGAERESLEVELLAMERRLWGEGHPRLSRALTSLGLTWMQQFRFDEAEPLLRKALAVAEQSRGPDHLEVAQACNNLAALLHGTKEFAEEAELYRRALRIWEGKLPPTFEGILTCRVNLAGALDKLGRDEECCALLKETLELAAEDRDIAGLTHRVMAEFLNSRNRWAEAEVHARQAAEIFRQLGGERISRVRAVHELAEAVRGQRRRSEAELLYAEADSLSRDGGRVPRPALPNLVRWGTCLQELGQLDEAWLRLVEARDRSVEEYGEDYPSRAELERALEQVRAARLAATGPGSPSPRAR